MKRCSVPTTRTSNTSNHSSMCASARRGMTPSSRATRRDLDRVHRVVVQLSSLDARRLQAVERGREDRIGPGRAGRLRRSARHFLKAASPPAGSAASRRRVTQREYLDAIEQADIVFGIGRPAPARPTWPWRRRWRSTPPPAPWPGRSCRCRPGRCRTRCPACSMASRYFRCVTVFGAIRRLPPGERLPFSKWSRRSTGAVLRDQVRCGLHVRVRQLVAVAHERRELPRRPGRRGPDRATRPRRAGRVPAADAHIEE